MAYGCPTDMPSANSVPEVGSILGIPNAPVMVRLCAAMRVGPVRGSEQNQAHEAFLLSDIRVLCAQGSLRIAHTQHDPWVFQEGEVIVEEKS